MRPCSGQYTTCCDRGGLAWLGGAIATRSCRGTIGYSLLRLCSSRSNATAGFCRLRSLGSLGSLGSLIGDCGVPLPRGLLTDSHAPSGNVCVATCDV